MKKRRPIIEKSPGPDGWYQKQLDSHVRIFATKSAAKKHNQSSRTSRYISRRQGFNDCKSRAHTQNIKSKHKELRRKNNEQDRSQRTHRAILKRTNR